MATDERVSGAPTARHPVSLSRREREILQAVAAGRSNKLTAYELGIAPSSVAGVVSRLCAKLGATCRLDLIRRVAPGGAAATEAPPTSA